MNTISTRLAIALAAYLDFERPHVLRAEVERAIQGASRAALDGDHDGERVKAILPLLHKSAVKLSKIQAGYTGPRTFESVLKATGQASAQLREIGL